MSTNYDGLPILIAHRGLSNLYPENTMAAFEGSVEDYGIKYLECDVRMSSDGIPVIIHDDTVDRTTNGTGSVVSKTYAELITLDAGDGEKIPSFEEYLSYANDNDCYIYPEIKGYRTQSDIDIMLNLIEQYNLTDKCVVQGFSTSDLLYVRSKSSTIILGFLGTNIDKLQDAIDNKPSSLLISYTYWLSNPADVKTVKNSGVGVCTWTVDSSSVKSQLLGIGVKNIMSNNPDIPISTSKHITYTSDTGTVSSSGEYGSGNYPAWEAFGQGTNISSDRWASDSPTDRWIKYEYSEVVKSASLQYRIPYTVDEQPKNFRIEISNDDINWSVVHTVELDTKITAGKYSPIYNIQGVHKYIRIYIVDTFSPTYMSIQQILLSLEYSEKIDYLTISNYTDKCRTEIKNVRHGVNMLRSFQDNSGLNFSIIQENLARFNGIGGSIDTTISANGATENLTMMLAFTFPENVDTKWRYIVNSSTLFDNRIYFTYNASLGAGKIKLGIGKYSQILTFDTSLSVNALCLVYNKETGKIQIAVDGASLPVGASIVFDGRTDNIILGAESTAASSPYKGYLVGGTVFSYGTATNTDWQSFWNSVKNITIPGG